MEAVPPQKLKQEEGLPANPGPEVPEVPPSLPTSSSLSVALPPSLSPFSGYIFGKEMLSPPDILTAQAIWTIYFPV